MEKKVAVMDKCKILVLDEVRKATRCVIIVKPAVITISSATESFEDSQLPNFMSEACALTFRSSFSTSNVRHVHLQADKLLSQDFKGMLDNVIAFLPPERQILLFSATFPLTVEQFMVSSIRYHFLDELLI